MKKETLYTCEECKSENTVKVIETITKKTTEIEIKKCTKCKHKHTIKKFFGWKYSQLNNYENH